MRSSALLIANPAAGRGFNEKILSRAKDAFASSGCKLDVRLTQKRGDAEGFAKEAREEGRELVVSAGGDGTLNEVANGLAKSQVPLGILPAGTTNVLARELKVPLDTKDAVQKALTGEAKKVCLGKVTFEGKDADHRYFLMMAGIGFDAKAVFKVSPGLKALTGKAAYVASGFQTLFSWHPDELVIDAAEGGTMAGYSLITCNTAKYAGTSSVAPDADIMEPVLKTFVMHGRRRTDLLRYVTGVLMNRHRSFKDISYVTSTSVKVQGKAYVQLDGDCVGEAPVLVEIVPEALNLIF